MLCDGVVEFGKELPIKHALKSKIINCYNYIGISI